jgi:hypothetical protein
MNEIEREKGCKYCSGNESLFWDKDAVNIREVYIELDGSITVSGYEGEDNKTVNLKIEYCPICGRKF